MFRSEESSDRKVAVSLPSKPSCVNSSSPAMERKSPPKPESFPTTDDVLRPSLARSLLIALFSYLFLLCYASTLCLGRQYCIAVPSLNAYLLERVL